MMSKGKKQNSNRWGTATRAIHSASGPEVYGPGMGAPIGTPIWQSSTFAFREPGEVADAATATRPETFYTRYGNPNFTAVQEAIAQLEGGEAALVTASGMAAIMLVFLGLLKNGDHVVAQTCHYVGTMKALEAWLPRYGIDVTLVEQTDLGAFEAAIRPAGARAWHHDLHGQHLRHADQSAADRARDRPDRAQRDEVPGWPQRCYGRLHRRRQ
jgi:O-acetylhomoserine/O-acetylserine sulfhydrylase-like pyridoxal-dependent enzyme